MAYAFAKIAFTPPVRAQQDKHGSGGYARLLSDERSGGDVFTDRECAFIERCDGFFQATVSATGWPYVQFRGGAPGFLRVEGRTTLAYADLRGNRQYISLGNLAGDNRIALIIVNYARAERLKIWGRADVEERPEIADTDWPEEAERRIRIRIEAFDWNCPRHIPRRLTEAEFGSELAELRAENAALWDKLTRLQARSG